MIRESVIENSCLIRQAVAVTRNEFAGRVILQAKEDPMTVTLNLPPDVEEAFQGEAQARGLSLDEFLSEVILSRAEQVTGQSAADASLSARLVREEGVPVLRTGRPIAISVVDETLDRVRREREGTILGLSD
jgi:hypothetical protein